MSAAISLVSSTTSWRHENIPVFHGQPLHPQTYGKIERYNRNLKTVERLETYYSPEQLERAVESFVVYYIHLYNELIWILIPAQVNYHWAVQILEQRKLTKARRKLARLKCASSYFSDVA